MDTPTLPLPLPLPFDDETDRAVPFVLTAAAHREVLGRTPPLTPVTGAPTRHDAPDDAPHDAARAAAGEAPDVAEAVAAGNDPDDTRRLQARALRRSGMPAATIAAALDVDAAVVTGWTADLDDELARRRRRRSQRTRRPGTGPVAAPAAAPAGDGGTGDVDVAALLPGLALALTVVDADGVTIAHDRLAPVVMLVDALRDAGAAAPERVRVALRVGTDEPLDRVRADVAQRLGVAPTTVTAGRASDGTRTGVRLRVDIREAAAAEQVRAWVEGSGLRGWDSNPQTFRLTADCSAS